MIWISQPAKPESRRLLTSPQGLGVTVCSPPGVAWDSPPTDWRLHLLHKVQKHRFCPTKSHGCILRLFLAILGPWLQSLPFCMLLFVIESINVYLIRLAPRFVTRHCFPAFCHLFSQLPSLSWGGCVPLSFLPGCCTVLEDLWLTVSSTVNTAPVLLSEHQPGV